MFFIPHIHICMHSCISSGQMCSSLLLFFLHENVTFSLFFSCSKLEKEVQAVFFFPSPSPLLPSFSYFGIFPPLFPHPAKAREERKDSACHQTEREENWPFPPFFFPLTARNQLNIFPFSPVVVRVRWIKEKNLRAVAVLGLFFRLRISSFSASHFKFNNGLLSLSLFLWKSCCG